MVKPVGRMAAEAFAEPAARARYVTTASARLVSVPTNAEVATLCSWAAVKSATATISANNTTIVVKGFAKAVLPFLRAVNHPATARAAVTMVAEVRVDYVPHSTPARMVSAKPVNLSVMARPVAIMAVEESVEPVLPERNVRTVTVSTV